MRTKNPFEAENQDELKDIAFYWLQKSYMLQVEKTALLVLLKERGIEINLADIIDKINLVQDECHENKP